MPPPGEIRVSRVECAERSLPGGEGRDPDVWMANAWFRAVLRHPQDALTLAGVGGGTIIDAAPWGWDDVLHEIAPLVGGGGLAVEKWTLEPDGLRLVGTVVSLPDRPADTPGAPREVRWSIDPLGPWLRLEGADGLWIHAAGDAEVLDGRILVGEVVIGHDGGLVHDLGGALRVEGAERLLVAHASEAWEWSSSETVPLSGRAPGATELHLFRDTERIGRLPLVDGGFDVRVGVEVTAVQAWAPGHAPSEPQPPGTDLHLALGPSGHLRIEPLQASRPFLVEWTSDDGRAGRVELPADGGRLPLGPGSYSLRLSAGPAWEPLEHQLDLPPEADLLWEAPLAPAFDPGPYLQVAIGAPSDVDRHFRGTNASAVRRLASRGVDHAVFTPADEAATLTTDDVEGWLSARNGARLTDRAGLWSIWSWSWASNPRDNAHGVHDIGGLSPEDALAVAWGGPSRDRFTAVDAAFLTFVGPPWLVEPRPDYVHLKHPDADPEGWARWFAWLDARATLGPLGPVTWVPVPDPSVWSTVDVERGLVRGRASAGTGPLLTLEVEGAGPGELLPVDGSASTVRAVLCGGPLDRLALVGTGGMVLAEDQGVELEAELVLEPGWLLALAWDEDGEEWAVTSPVWLETP